jgi:hypothetical protein
MSAPVQEKGAAAPEGGLRAAEDGIDWPDGHEPFLYKASFRCAGDDRTIATPITRRGPFSSRPGSDWLLSDPMRARSNRMPHRRARSHRRVPEGVVRRHRRRCASARDGTCDCASRHSAGRDIDAQLGSWEQSGQLWDPSPARRGLAPARSRTTGSACSSTSRIPRCSPLAQPKKRVGNRSSSGNPEIPFLRGDGPMRADRFATRRAQANRPPRVPTHLRGVHGRFDRGIRGTTRPN